MALAQDLIQDSRNFAATYGGNAYGFANAVFLLIHDLLDNTDIAGPSVDIELPGFENIR